MLRFKSFMKLSLCVGCFRDTLRNSMLPYCGQDVGNGSSLNINKSKNNILHERLHCVVLSARLYIYILPVNARDRSSRCNNLSFHMRQNTFHNQQIVSPPNSNISESSACIAVQVLQAMRMFPVANSCLSDSFVLLWTQLRLPNNPENTFRNFYYIRFFFMTWKFSYNFIQNDTLMRFLKHEKS